MSDISYDAVVIGGGNAGFSAASSASQEGAKVLLLEKAPKEWVGGNTYFTAGSFRTAFGGLDDIIPCLKSFDQSTKSKIDMKPYTQEDFYGDLMRVTKGRSDPQLARELVNGSRNAIQWLVDNGLRFELAYNRQAFVVDGIQKFWGGIVMYSVDGGKGLVRFHQELAAKSGVDVWFETPAINLEVDEASESVKGVWILKNNKKVLVKTSNVIMACGGFQANPSMRAQYLGPQWDYAHVRGTKYNEGDGHIMAQKAGAKPAGNYSGCHSVAWDSASPFASGDRILTNQFTKSGYPLGIMVNSTGKRFVDEGVDLRNYTYAIFGREILRQPNGFAFQIWDADGASWLRKEEYDPSVTKRIEAPTLEALADLLVERGLGDKRQFLETVSTFNDAVEKASAERPDIKFNPAIKDDLSTQSSKVTLPLPKTNWAIPIKKGPFLAVEVTCGVTFTFGGLAVQPTDAAVISRRSHRPLSGLYCAGEMVGNVFWNNYPGGSGLTLGTVFGLKAGRSAAKRALSLSHSSKNSKL